MVVELDHVLDNLTYSHLGAHPAIWIGHDDAAIIACARTAPSGGALQQPVLFINGEWDAICDINRSRLGEPMRLACRDLSVTHLAGGHWLPLERKNEVAQAIRSWLQTRGLK